MKCQKIECIQRAVEGQKYCSREHAPYAHLAGSIGKSSLYDRPMERSSKEELGELWEPSSEEDSKIESELRVTTKPVKRKEFIKNTPSSAPRESSGPTENALSGEDVGPSNTVNAGTNGLTETVLTSSSKNKAEEKTERPPEVSIEPSSTTEMVESRSLSLVDDTAKHLHGLMASLSNRNDRMAPTVPQVHAAVECGKAIYQLMRLKLDAIQAAHRMRKEL